jgi:hypothetical protein
MSWYVAEKYNRKLLVNVNEQMKMLKGELGDLEARVTLIDFMRSNLGLTVELLSGVKLAPYQELTLKAMLDRNRSMCIWGRGCAKSFIAAIFCFLQCIFEPKSKVMIAGPTFRTARIIFENYLEKIVKSPGAELLMQAFGGPPSKKNDQYRWDINQGLITAIPLNGEKIRGFRANILVIDEYLLMPQDIIENVLKPFLSSPLDIDDRIKIREEEDRFIRDGRLREDQRIKFSNMSKMAALSSASYTFENLYSTYLHWKTQIESPQESYEVEELKDQEEPLTYFISQLSYEVLPKHMIDQSVAKEAKNGGSSRASFQREYCAQFVDESDGYFSAKKMAECTLKTKESPAALVSGRAGKKYLLAIDPNYSTSKKADFFAMAVMELDDDRKEGTLVHGYARAGSDLKVHIRYLYYLLNFFDIEMIVIDNADFAFIDAANESALFKAKGLNIKFFEVDTDLDGNDYQAMLRVASRQYNKDNGALCFKQVFTPEFIRRSNQHLQYCIDYKKIWFASKVQESPADFDRAVHTSIPSDLIPFDDLGDLAEFQDVVIYNTKQQCAMIELATTTKGHQTFDLPTHLKQDSTEKRARKDNYTALLLANWATKLYYDMKDAKPSGPATFKPFFV